VVGPKGFLTCERGAIAILAAASLIVLVGLMALSIDVGVAFFAQEQLQQAVDLAVLKAVTDPTNATSLAQTTVDDNVGAGTLSQPLSVVAGEYPPPGYDWATIGTLDVASRFSPGGDAPNALQITAQRDAPLFLSRLLYSGTMPVSAQATAYNQPLTQLTIGTGALSVDSQQSAANNALLSSFLGTNISLDAVSYQGLANANVDMFGFLDALISITGGTSGDYSAILNASVTLPEVMNALAATVASDSGLAGSASTLTTALDTLGSETNTLGPFTVGSVIQLADITASRAVGAQLNLFAFLTASAEQINASSMPTTTVSIPVTGGSITVQSAVIEPAQSSVVGGVGISASSAQIRLDIDIVPASPITVLGTNIAVQFPVYVTSLAGEATVTALNCNGPDSANATVVVSAQDGPASASSENINSSALYQSIPPAAQPAQLAYAAGLVNVTASGTQSITGSPQTLTFSAPFSSTDTQTVSLSQPLSTVMTYLVTNDSYSVTALGVPIPTSTVMSQLTPILDAIAPEADGVIGDLLSALGASDAYMAVTVPYVRCSNPVLAQ